LRNRDYIRLLFLDDRTSILTKRQFQAAPESMAAARIGQPLVDIKHDSTDFCT
jgi:hypothetical protein